MMLLVQICADKPFIILFCKNPIQFSILFVLIFSAWKKWPSFNFNNLFSWMHLQHWFYTEAWILCKSGTCVLNKLTPFTPVNRHCMRSKMIYIYRIYIEPHKCVHLNASLMMKADPTSPPILVQLFTPQEGHSFTNSHIVVVKVAKAGKCDSRESEETCPSHLDFKVSMNVVGQNLAKTPRKHTNIGHVLKYSDL